MKIQRLLTSIRTRSLVEAHHAPSGTVYSRPRERAYPVPWIVSERRTGEWIELFNASEERLSFVRFATAGEGELALSLPQHIDSGCSVRLAVDRIPSDSAVAMIIVCWRRPSGVPYLWLLSV